MNFKTWPCDWSTVSLWGWRSMKVRWDTPIITYAYDPATSLCPITHHHPLCRLAGHVSQLKGSPAPCGYSSPYWLCSSLKLNKMHPIECTAHKRIFIWILSTDKASPGIISRAHLPDLIARFPCSQFLSQHSSWKYFLSEGKTPLCWFIIIIILDLKSSPSSIITSSV